MNQPFPPLFWFFDFVLGISSSCDSCLESLRLVIPFMIFDPISAVQGVSRPLFRAPHGDSYSLLIPLPSLKRVWPKILDMYPVGILSRIHSKLSKKRIQRREIDRVMARKEYGKKINHHL
ncbi:hypothetical protein B0H63DRAFT_479729 [Podospora didyma]|uniref:Uncharacterized protein n=1 Tax=Podospora didyma TaxID=330526 RepID=A0AAE0KKM6_9PEZI|nr:hypothetical protein B0H63DRAFT_479729 [Podospora didyma]